MQAALMAGVIAAAARVPLLREAMSMRGDALQPRYRRGFRDRGMLAGRYLPQPRVRTSDGRELLLDELLGGGFAVVGAGCDPQRALEASNREFLRQLGAVFLRLTTQDPPRAGEARDVSGELARRLHEGRPRLFIVRPDRFVFADGPPERADAMVAAMRRGLFEDGHRFRQESAGETRLSDN